jgi:hypothetical protein
MSKAFPKIIGKNFDVRFSRLFFIAFSGVSQFSAMGVTVTATVQWEFKGTTKNVLQKGIKSRVEKFLQKIDQKSKPIFFSIFFSRLWAFLGEGSKKKNDKNIEKINPGGSDSDSEKAKGSRNGVQIGVGCRFAGLQGAGVSARISWHSTRR